MQDDTEIEKMLLGLLAQTQRSFPPSELERVQALVDAGDYRQAVETLCRFAAQERHPLPMQARAMVFKLADRLGMDPAALGMLD